MRALRRMPKYALDTGPVLLIAVIAAVLSFTHISDLAADNGQKGWKSWVIAICIDLTCVMAARERQRDKHTDRKARGLVSWPTLVLAGGVTLTLAANLAEAARGVWAHIVTGTPAAAFLIAISMLERRTDHQPADDEPLLLADPPTATLDREPAPADLPELTADEEPVPAPIAAPQTPLPNVNTQRPVPAGPGPSPALVAYARQVADQYRTQHAEPITADRLSARVRVSTELATTLLDEITTTH